MDRDTHDGLNPAPRLPPADMTFRHFQKPTEVGGALCLPAWQDWPTHLRKNQESLQNAKVTLIHRPLREWKAIATHAAQVAANAYQASFPWPLHPWNSSLPYLVGGHQPELFHLGVWYKNALLAQASHAGIANTLHLQVDHDLCRSLSIKVPSLQNGTWITSNVAIEPTLEPIPWQMLHVRNPEDWKSFPDRVHRALGHSLRGSPLLDEAWDAALQALHHHRPVGEILSSARRQIEHSLGWRNAEIPFSHLASNLSFGAFLFHTLLDLPRFHTAFHSARDAYRLHHRIRNAAQPIPRLALDGEWSEAPFWIYRNEDPMRRPLWCRSDANSLTLSDRVSWERTWKRDELTNDLEQAWNRIDHSAIHLRPRALTLTLYARLFLADFFLHGIGGGKYDQMTDLILYQWLGVDPPSYGVASATTHLPLSNPVPPSASVQKVRQHIWESKFHGEWPQFRPTIPSPSWDILVTQKQQLLAHIPPRGAKKDWHDRLTTLNHALSQFASSTLPPWNAWLEETESLQRQRSICESRDYAWLLMTRDGLSHSPLVRKEG